MVYAHTRAAGYMERRVSSSQLQLGDGGEQVVVWSPAPVEGCDVYCYWDAFSWYGSTTGLNVLLLHEPITVLPGQYNPQVWERFDHILTPYRELSDRGGKFQWCASPAYDVPHWREASGSFYVRKADTLYWADLLEKEFPRSICMINGYKSSAVPGELYSSRLKIADWYYQNGRMRLDVYGTGAWPCLNYQGAIEPHYQSKFHVLREYGFSIVFENVYHEKWSRGWVTEKMLDCFLCGTVPIYLGAYDIEEYIPTCCFIDMWDFHDFQSLDNYLLSITDDQYAKRQANIKTFISGGTRLLSGGGLDLYSIHGLYDKLFSLAGYGSGESPQVWEPAKANDEKREWVMNKATPVYTYRELAEYHGEA